MHLALRAQPTLIVLTAACLLGGVVPARPALAEDADTEPDDSGESEAEAVDEVGHETIIIVGRRIPEPLSLAARSVSVVDDEALAERPPRTVPEALWDAPGVFVQHTNYGGGSPIVRGLIGPQNLILVDGVRLNNSVYRTGPLQYLNLVDAQSIERIEVLRGAGSVLYGSDAMGGVIQVVPISSRDYRGRGLGNGGGRVLARYSSADQGRIAHAHLEGGQGGISGVFGATYKDFVDLTGGRGIGEQVYSGYQALSAVGGMTYRFPDGALADWTLTARYLMTQISDAGRTDKLLDKHSLQMYDNDDHLAYGRLHMKLDQLRSKGDVTLSYQSFFERKDNIAVADDLATQLGATRDQTFVDTLGLDLQLVSSLVPERLWLQYGGMWYRDWVDADRSTWTPASAWRPSMESNYPSGSTYDNFGGFALLEGDAVRLDREQAVRLGGGYRLHGMAGHAPAQNSLPSADFDHLGHVVFGSAQYLRGEDHTVALTFAQGFRAPNLNEAVMLGDTGKFFHIPNADLGPERSDTLELSGRTRTWRIDAQLAGYVSLLHDLIKREETEWDGETEIGGKPVVWNVNGEEGILWGIEPRVGIDLGQGVMLSGSLAYTWGKEKVTGGSNQPLTRIPPLFGQVRLRWDVAPICRGRVFVEGYMRGATKQDRLSSEDESDARIPSGGTPGWSTWNARLGYITDSVAWTLAVENITNEAFKYHGSGVYAPGTNAILSVETFR